jgi:hypothetical protein
MFARAFKTSAISLLIFAFALPVGKLKYFISSAPLSQNTRSQGRRKAVQVQQRTPEAPPANELRLSAIKDTVRTHQRVDFEYFFYCCQATPELFVPPPRA